MQGVSTSTGLGRATPDPRRLQLYLFMYLFSPLTHWWNFVFVLFI